LKEKEETQAMNCQLKLVGSTLATFLLLSMGRGPNQISASTRTPFLSEDQTFAGNIQPLAQEGEELNDIVNEVHLERRCGEVQTRQKGLIHLPDGFSYVESPVRYRLLEPPDRPKLIGCHAIWDPRTRNLTYECWCSMHDQCNEDEGHRWTGPKSELKAVIHLIAKKKSN
jgi:hypothetical protein